MSSLQVKRLNCVTILTPVLFPGQSSIDFVYNIVEDLGGLGSNFHLERGSSPSR